MSKCEFSSSHLATLVACVQMGCVNGVKRELTKNLPCEYVLAADFQRLPFRVGRQIFKILWEFVPHVFVSDPRNLSHESRFPMFCVMRFNAFSEILATQNSTYFAIMCLRDVVGKDLAQIIGKKIWDSRCDEEWELN